MGQTGAVGEDLESNFRPKMPSRDIFSIRETEATLFQQKELSAGICCTGKRCCWEETGRGGSPGGSKNRVLLLPPPGWRDKAQVVLPDPRAKVTRLRRA